MRAVDITGIAGLGLTLLGAGALADEAGDRKSHDGEARKGDSDRGDAREPGRKGR